jgi:hypothetical protein
VLAVSVYVAFRSRYPEEATVEEVLKKLQESNIDTSQFVKLTVDHCQQMKSSEELEVPHRDTGVGDGTHPSTFSNLLGE